MGLPSSEPRPKKCTEAPACLAMEQASTTSSSWFSPSVMTTIIGLASLLGSNALMQVSTALPTAVPWVGTMPGSTDLRNNLMAWMSVVNGHWTKASPANTTSPKRSLWAAAVRRSTVRFARSIRGIPTSSASMLLLTSTATMTSTPSDSTSSKRLPILGSSHPTMAAPRAQRHSRNFQVGRNMRYSSYTVSTRWASASCPTTRCLQRKCHAITTVAAKAVRSRGAASGR